MTLPMEWHTEHHSGDTIDKIDKGANALYDFSQGTFELIYMAVKLIGSFAVLVYFSPSAGCIVLAMMIASIIITARFDRVLIEKYTKLNHAENHIAESIFDAISNITTVIILRVEKLIFSTIMRKIEEPFALRKRANMLNEYKWFLTDLCCALMTVLVLGTYFWNHVGKPHSVLIGTIYLLMKYLEDIGELFAQFTSKYGTIIFRRTQVLNAEELAEDFRGESFNNHVLPATWREIRIDGLNFSYTSNEEAHHLVDIAMSFRRGERIALVGESGSGKTTTLKIARDLYHPQSVRLSVDDASIPHGFDGISRAIGLIPQDPEIFSTTILKNITLGAEYPMEVVRRFTDMACFTEVVERLPNGFDSSIKEKGVNLSGGEKQRLALARGLLACKDKDIVLLDEPTASLDPMNELQICKNVFTAFTDKAIISSVHRLHLLPLFHRIYVFSEGRIVASGTLGDLLLTCPEFQKLWEQYHRQETESVV